MSVIVLLNSHILALYNIIDSTKIQYTFTYNAKSDI